MTPSPSAEFPTPATHPTADVVLFDGECNFCRAQMERLRAWDADGRLAYLSLHDPLVAERWPDLSHERLLREMCVIEAPGEPAGGTPEGSVPDGGVSIGDTPRHWGADAVRYLSWKLPRLRWLAPLLHLPGVMRLARPVYGFVSRNRYRIGGKRIDCESDACSLHR